MFLKYWVSNINFSFCEGLQKLAGADEKEFITIGHPIPTMADPSESNPCCPPDCCDMRGLLAFQILWELDREPMNGQQIAEKIAVRRGTKPTPGTIYPALKELKESGLIKGNRQGRQIIYKLTVEGERGLADASRYFLQAFGDIAEDVKVKVIVIRRDDCGC
jgi:DNA-binding PadR family transcriptional regulator